MNSPITWRNVDAPDLRGAAGIFNGAQTAINTGFDAFNKVIKEQEAMDASNWKVGKENNTQAFLNALDAIQNPEDLIAKRAALTEMLAGYGSQVDQAAARGALDGREAILQNRMEAAAKYKEFQGHEADKPHYDALTGFATKGDLKGGQEYLAANKFANAGAAAKFFNDSMASYNQQKLSGLQLSNETEAAKTAAEQRALLTEIAAKSSEHRAMRDAQGLEIGRLASINGLPMNSDGTPKLETYTDAQRQKLRDVLLAAKSTHSLQDYETGDTAAANAFENTLTKSGKYSPALLMQNRDAIRQALSTTANRGSIGNAATTRDWNEASTQAVMEDRSLYVPSAINSSRTQENEKRLMEYIDNKYSGSERTMLRRSLNKITTEGIDVGGQKVVPSYNDILKSLGNTDDDFFSTTGWSLKGGDIGDKFERNLKEQANKLESKQLVKDAAEYDKWHTRQRAHELFYGTNKK